MTVRYVRHFSTRKTPQTEAVPGKNQVQNSAGGFGFQIDDFARLDRFLVLGSEGGTYYAGERELTRENAECVLRCAAHDFARTVNHIAEISDSGRAPKNDPAIFALALIVGLGSPEAQHYALSRLNDVCRIGTHLFQFVQAVKELRGFGRGLRKGISHWYTSRSCEDLAYQIVKYQQRGGMSHRDVLRLCHPRGCNSAVLRYATGATLDGRTVVRKQSEGTYSRAEGNLPDIVYGFEQAKKAETAKQIVHLIRAFNLPRECIPTQFLNDPSVWEALLEKMGLTAMIRNLGKMTSIGLLKPLSQAAGRVITALGNEEQLRKSRVHPIAVLAALMTYGQGHGEKGKLTWDPVQSIVDALDGAFYGAFGNVEPTNKRWLLGCDISGSMYGANIAGIPGLTAGVATGALALVTAAVEPNHYIVGFTSRNGGWSGSDNAVTPISISPRMRLDTVCQRMRAMTMGRTDCALPVLHAIENNVEVDAFVVLTDNESYDGDIHVFQALEKYRQKTGINAKLIACGMTATEYSIADPSNPNMMDVVGFDTATPSLMADFVRG